jgi:hypothetical protein
MADTKKKRCTISVGITIVMSIVIAISFVFGIVGTMEICPDGCPRLCPYTCTNMKNVNFLVSIAICSVMTSAGLVFCIVSIYVGFRDRVDRSKMGYDQHLYDNQSLVTHGTAVLIGIITLLTIIGCMALGFWLNNSSWNYTAMVFATIFIHTLAGSSIGWAYFPFGYFKQVKKEYAAVPVDEL